MLQPLLATPALKSPMLEVSWRPVRRRALSWVVTRTEVTRDYYCRQVSCHLPPVRVVRLDVGVVVLGQRLDGGLYGGHAPRLPHGLGGVVGVRPRPCTNQR